MTALDQHRPPPEKPDEDYVWRGYLRELWPFTSRYPTKAGILWVGLFAVVGTLIGAAYKFGNDAGGAELAWYRQYYQGKFNELASASATAAKILENDLKIFVANSELSRANEELKIQLTQISERAKKVQADLDQNTTQLRMIQAKYDDEIKGIRGDKIIIKLPPNKTETLFGDKKIAIQNVFPGEVHFVFDNKSYNWGAASNLTYSADGKTCLLALMTFDYHFPETADFEIGCKNQ
jgi:hypothetical protein